MAAPDEVLWTGGAQWVGKTSVARQLARAHCLQLYECDYHDSRSHSWRVHANPARYPAFSAFLARTADQNWVMTTPRDMTMRANAIFDERFDMVVEDLAPLPAELAFLVEGWCVRPRHLAPLLTDRSRAVFLVPSEAFVRRQIEVLERAGSARHLGVSDAERAQRNRLERDRLLASEVVEDARQNGFEVVTVDENGSIDEVTSLVQRLLRLPRHL